MQTRTYLVEQLADPQVRQLLRLRREDVDKIAAALVESFETRSVGLQDLARRAHRELCILVIKRSVPTYKAEFASGIPPEEYFQRFYSGLFKTCEIPSHSISIVDPNLHAFLKRRKALPDLTRSLRTPGSAHPTEEGPSPM